jgi:cellulose synthase (UDP-forming)
MSSEGPHAPSPLVARGLFGHAALALEVEHPERLRSWLWRLFVRPAPAEPGRAARALGRALGLAGRRLGASEARSAGRDARLHLGADADPAPPAGAGRRLVDGAGRLWLGLRSAIPQIDHTGLGQWLESAADAPLLRGAPLRVIGLLLCGFLFWLGVTTPLNWSAQLVFTLALCLLAIQIRNTPGTVPTLMLMALALLASCRYGWWRLTQSTDLEPGWETVLGVLLLGAELYAWLIMVLGFAQCAWPLQRRPTALPERIADWPLVDIYIPTYNEPLDVIRPTVLACKGIDWPADRMRIYLLDDGRREPVRRFAEQAGIGYLARPDNRHAKAGNLNHALALTHGEFIAIFDCDHLPVRSFLQTTMGCLLRDPGCAMVQTPHHFFSPDPFERNLETFRRIPSEGSLFYGLVQDGNDFWNATFFCGSSAVLRRAPLLEIGGVAVETITEDAHTALKLHRHGYRTAYLNVTQAAGLATESLAQMVGQRIRWARGMAQIFRVDNPLLGRGLSLMQRLCYSNAMLHFFYGIPRLIFLTAPLAYLYFELHIIRSSAAIFALYLLPHLVLPHITTARMQGAYRHSFWAEVYETALAWYITVPTTLAFLRPGTGRFNVTAKGGLVKRTHFDWSISRPYFGLVLLNAIGLLIGLVRLVAWNRFEAGTVLLNLVWTAFNLLMLGAAIGVAHERRQVRGFHRVAAQLPVGLILADGHTHRCSTTNYSLQGIGVHLAAPLALEKGAPVQVLLQSGDAEQSFAARVVAQRGARLGLQFVDTSLERQQQLIRCTFGRADAWAHWHEQYAADLPLRGLGEIVRLGLHGYASLLQSAGRALRRRLLERTHAAFETAEL